MENQEGWGEADTPAFQLREETGLGQLGSRAYCQVPSPGRCLALRSAGLLTQVPGCFPSLYLS